MIHQSIPYKVHFGQVDMCNATFYACDLLGEQIKLLKAIKHNWGLWVVYYSEKILTEYNSMYH